jgi:hypothetical protein
MLGAVLVQISRHFKILSGLGSLLLLAAPLSAQSAGQATGYSKSLVSKIVSGGLLGGAAGALAGSSQDGRIGAKGPTGPVGAAGADNLTAGAPGSDFGFNMLAGDDIHFFFVYDGSNAPICKWRGIVTYPDQTSRESGEFDGVYTGSSLVGGSSGYPRVGTYTITFHQTSTGPAPARCRCWLRTTNNPTYSRFEYTFPNTMADQQMSFTFVLDPDVMSP